MRQGSAGDFNYESLAIPYTSTRLPDPRIAAHIRTALGDVKTMINVGAGAGSYEPSDLSVTAVEPSASMRALRKYGSAPVISAIAENLPFKTHQFDAALASLTLHQWKSLAHGLSELRRVTKGRIVILTSDPVAMPKYWLAEYAPHLMLHEQRRMPGIDVIAELLGGHVRVESIHVPADCSDGFNEAYFARPEAFLDERVRRGQSAWGFVKPVDEKRFVDELRSSLEAGTWDQKHGHHRKMPFYDGSMRLVIHEPQ